MKKPKRIRAVILATAAACGITLSAAAPAYALSPAEYTVVKGDSLFKVGQVFSTTVDGLMKDNNLKTTSLNIGQVLKVPCDTYTVIKGDTLYLISQKFKISLDTLRRANNIYTDSLNIGQVLNLPGLKPQTGETEDDTSDSGAYTAAEIDLLARLVHAEAQGEPYETKVAVGAVVVNRMESGLFSSTISGVIYQNINGYYQFTPVVNGWIDKPADAEAVKAAKEALGGADPSKGALFYYDTGTTNTWILSKPVTARIGTMVFAL